MTAKRVFLFLLLLLSCGTSFSFSSESQPFNGQEISIQDFQFEEESTDLYQGTVPFFKTKIFPAYPLNVSKSFLLQSCFETLTQENYLRRSKEINPGLSVPTIIFPFHVFL